MSGIYIPGMEMPTSCCACPFFKSNMSKQLFCKAFGAFDRKDYDKLPLERMKNCPLIPVPEHGRLIEWVSVKERLPEAGVSVLCACRANIYDVMKMRTDGAWVHNDAVYASTYMGGFVTHWAELPTIIPADEEGEG